MKRLRLSLDTVFPILRGACPSYGLESSQRSIRLVFENRGSDNACWLGGLAMACLLIFVVGASSLELAYGQSRVYSWEGNYPFFDGNLIADGNWRCLWLGFGNGQVTEGTLMLRPTGSTQPWETHSALVRSEFGLGVEWDFSVDAVTINQLRTHATVGGTIAEPNPWENVWIMAELADDGSAGLYFILKSNGVELGAYRFYGHEQAFLFTSNSPVLSLGVAYTYRLFRQGTMVTVMVNDEVVASASLEPVLHWVFGDKIGLYTEDAEVRFSDVVIHSGVTSENLPVVTILSPLNGEGFLSGEQVFLDALALDAAGGDVSHQVRWSSSVDGPIGEGVGLLISLSGGKHEITATVSDSAGNTATDRMQIQMGELSQPSSTEIVSVQD